MKGGNKVGKWKKSLVGCQGHKEKADCSCVLYSETGKMRPWERQLLCYLLFQRSHFNTHPSDVPHGLDHFETVLMTLPSDPILKHKRNFFLKQQRMFCYVITLFNRLASWRLLIIYKNRIYPQGGNIYIHLYIYIFYHSMSFEIKNLKIYVFPLIEIYLS